MPACLYPIQTTEFRQMFQRFLGYYKGQMHLFVIDIIAAITVAGIDLAFPQILRSLTGGLWEKRSSSL